ncbi:MAG: hypothetical protein IPP72_17895 [Chitinophagaceae bacterium]|nr:hypothetical protein [Chitinophagaceae bacterium]
MKNVIAFLLLFNIYSSSHSQLAGCTDPLAGNYNAAASSNNGSCTYNITTYTPIIKVDPLTDSLVETSCLHMAGGYLWSFNDKGGKAALYRIDTISNTLQQRVILSGAVNTDWEELAFDGTYLYVGDFGNNQNGGRTDLKIYKFPFSSINLSNAVDTIPAAQIETIHFTYSDQPQPATPSGYNNTKFDCEAMIVDNNKIHLFSKNWADNNTTHYLINNSNAGNYIAAAMETFATGYLVTAADKVPGQNIITLLGYQNSGTGNHYLHILSDYKADSFFTGNKRRIDLGDATVMGQSEGLAFRNGKYGYISNEKFTRMVGPFTITVNQKLRSFDISNFVGDYFTQYIFTGSGNWSDAANWKYNLKPPSTVYPGNEIIIDPVATGDCKLDIPYTLAPGSKLTTRPGKSFLIQGNLTLQ